MRACDFAYNQIVGMFLLVFWYIIPRGQLVDCYDGGDHVHIWSLKFKERRTYLGSAILRTEKIFGVRD